MAAIANWSAGAVDFPGNGTPREKLGCALKQATLAGLARGWQSGEARLTDQAIELFARSGPAAANAFDPEGREVMIQCGAVLQHLKLILLRHDCLGRVDLFPDLAEPKLAARVHLGSGGGRGTLEQQLLEALEVGEVGPRWREQPVAAATVDLLSRAGAGERAWGEFAHSESSRQRLAELLGRGDRVQLRAVRFQNETLVRAADGSWEASGFTGTTLHERFSRWRRPAMPLTGRAVATFSHSARGANEPETLNGTFAVLKTKTDDKHGWLAAGQTMARLLLHARAFGLAGTAFLEALRSPELRAELRTVIGHKGFMQVILRFAAARLAGDIPADAPQARTEMTSLDRFHKSCSVAGV